MEHTDPEQILEFLRDLGGAVQSPARLEIGGSSALMLVGLLDRATEDIDAVDEVPEVLRTQAHLLETLANRYGLRLAHFQSHYLPSRWRERLRFLNRFGSLDVYLVDALDILVGKLFSNREKDRDDLRMLKKQIARDDVVDRLRHDAAPLLAEPPLRANAARNWYVLYGDDLPT
jgi:hypothetical protein